jgi:hypothetical protein
MGKRFTRRANLRDEQGGVDVDWAKLAKDLGIPAVVVLYWFYKDWVFSMRQLVAQERNTENNAKMTTILEIIQRDGVKCRHD